MAKQTFVTGQVLTAAQQNSLQSNDYNQTVTTVTTNYVLLAADVGTRVYMNAAGATTITVNTGLFAAGDTVFLGNIGAGSCVVTPGTATVSKFSTASLTLSQYQGAYLYFVSTGAAILYSDSAGSSLPLTTKGDLFGFDTANARVPIGTNNQVLTADSAQALGLKWATPTAAAFSGCALSRSADQTITTGTNTAMTFDTEIFDTDSYHSTSVNTSRITIPAGKAGKFLLLGYTQYAGNTTGYRQTQFKKNGSAIAQNLSSYTLSGALSTNIEISLVVDLAVADYVELFVQQNSGSNLDVQGVPSYTLQFSATYLGA